MTLVAGTFVSSAVRMPVEIQGGLMRTARQQYKSACKAMEQHRIFSRFELDEDKHLYCTFSQDSGLLLGETIRDWLTGAEEGLQNFLWCEKLEEGALALVYVLDGQVLRETFMAPLAAPQEMEQLVRRGQARDPDFRVFFYNLAWEDVGLAPEIKTVALEQSILDHVKRNKATLPRAGPYRVAIARIATSYRILRILIVGIFMAAVILPATYYGARYYHDVEDTALAIGVFESPQHKRLVQEHSRLLAGSNPSEILPALHKALMQFLSDSVFSDYWHIQTLQWSRGGSYLQIRAVLLKGAGPLEDEGETLDQDRQAQLMEAADRHGWTLVLDGFSGVFHVPVEWESRTEDEVNKLRRLFPPASEKDSWHLEQLITDMAPVGELEADAGGNTQNAVYLTQSVVLRLTEDPWPTGETARWLGQRLAGGPLLLDSVSLQAAPDSTGGRMDGTIGFSLIWRKYF